MEGWSWGQTCNEKSWNTVRQRGSPKPGFPPNCQVSVCTQKCTPNANTCTVNWGWWPRAPHREIVMSGCGCSEAAQAWTGECGREVRDLQNLGPQNRDNFGERAVLWAELRPPPQSPHVEALNPGTSECDCSWQLGLWRGN